MLAPSLILSRPLLLLLSGLAVASLASNLLSFSGDPQIHLVFARNLLAGHPLQFNPGIYSSGESSPLYMLVVAALLASFGQGAAAIAMKLLGVSCALWLLACMYRELRASFDDGPAAACLTMSFAVAPFFFFQAQLGMENMPFALAVALIVRRSFEPSSWLASLARVACAHLLFFLRPEALFLVALLYAGAFRERQRLWLRLASYVACSALLALSVLWIERATAVPLHGAGAMRLVTSRLAALHIPGTGVYLSPRALGFTAYAWPLLLAIALHARRIDRARWLVFACLVGLPFVLYALTLLPTTHLSRYTLFWWFPLLLVFAHALRSDRRAQLLFASVLVLNTVAVSAVEVALRMRERRYLRTDLRPFLAASQPGAVERFSSQLCAQIDCSHAPVGIALSEVQLRLRLDTRFVVRSLDGVVDIGLAPHVSERGEIDLVSYLEAKHVDLVLDFPNSPAPPGRASLATIFRRTEGGPVYEGCSRFERIVFREWLYPHGLLRRDLPGCSEGRAE